MKWGFLGAMRDMAGTVRARKGGSSQLVGSGGHFLNIGVAGLYCDWAKSELKKILFFSKKALTL